MTVSTRRATATVGNRIRDSRRAMNFLFPNRSLVGGNDLLAIYNATGLTILNSDGIIIRSNRIAHAMDASGAGIALKESGAALVIGNEIIHCAVGILADSPLNTASIASASSATASRHNVTGINFYGGRGGHLIYYNRFRTACGRRRWAATSGTTSMSGTAITGTTTGFDRNQDGIGDTPYEIRAYADRIWMDTPMARFFRSSPLLGCSTFSNGWRRFPHRP